MALVHPESIFVVTCNKALILSAHDLTLEFEKELINIFEWVYRMVMTSRKN
jgi:hypothetical protein